MSCELVALPDLGAEETTESTAAGRAEDDRPGRALRSRSCTICAGTPRYDVMQTEPPARTPASASWRTAAATRSVASWRVCSVTPLPPTNRSFTCSTCTEAPARRARAPVKAIATSPAGESSRASKMRSNMAQRSVGPVSNMLTPKSGATRAVCPISLGRQHHDDARPREEVRACGSPSSKAPCPPR